MNAKNKILLFILSLVGMTFGFGLSFKDDGSVDARIVAIVGKRPILSTEIDQTLLSYGVSIPSDTSLFYDLCAEVLENLINEELIYQAGERKSIIVDDTVLNAEFTSRWDTLLSRFGGEQKLSDTLKAEGLSIGEFKYKVKEQVRIGLMKRIYIERHIGYIDVSRDEVQRFYEENIDSLGDYPAQAYIYQIDIGPPPDSVRWQMAENRASEIYSLLLSGKPFEIVAESLSNDSKTKSIGGRIGILNIADLPQTFRSAVSQMKAGEFSKPVRGENGFHILKTFSIDDEKVDLAHIFIMLPATKDAMMQIARYVYTLAMMGNDFGELASQYSSDTISAGKNGELGWIPLENIEQIKKAIFINGGMTTKAFIEDANEFKFELTIPSDIKPTIEINDTVIYINESQSVRFDNSGRLTVQHIDKDSISFIRSGTILPPVMIGNHYFIYMIGETKPAEKLSIENHYEFLRAYARNDKFMSRLQKIIQSLRKKTFVDIRDERIKSRIHWE